MAKAYSRCTDEAGNILFLILLAVVLFAGLSYAVTHSMRNGGKDASSENAKATAAQILQYASLLENGINRLRVVNNCSDTDINFVNTVIALYSNSIAPADKHCNLFDPRRRRSSVL